MRERHYSTIILSYCWRPQDHRTTGPEDQRTTGPEDHRTRGIFFSRDCIFFSRAVFFFQGTFFFSSVIPCLKTQRQGISCLKDKYCFLGPMISNCFYTWKKSYHEGTVYFPKKMNGAIENWNVPNNGNMLELDVQGFLKLPNGFGEFCASLALCFPR